MVNHVEPPRIHRERGSGRHWAERGLRASAIFLMACYSTHLIADYAEAFAAHRRGDGRALLIAVRKAVENKTDQGHVALIHELYASLKAERPAYGSSTERYATYALLGKAVDEGPAQAQFELGTLMTWQHGGLEYWRKAAIGGHAQAAYDYAWTAGSQKEISRQEQFEWFKKSAELGYPDAQRRLVDAYHPRPANDPNPSVVPANPAEAFRWMKHLATREDLPLDKRAGDISHLASMYFRGIVVQKDYCESFRLYNLLLDKGYDVLAERGLWQFFEHGYCTAPDPAKAKAYRERSMPKRSD